MRGHGEAIRMGRTIGLVCAAGLALATADALTGAPAARADVYRVPASGSPALAVDAPAGWKGEADPQGRIVLTASDGSGILELILIADPKLATMKEADMAAELFKSLGVPPYTRSEPDAIGGVRGQAFIGGKAGNGGAVGLRLVLVRLDPTRMALMVETTRQPLTAARSAALKQLIGRISLVR
jgi:hypothetical protein